MKQSVSIPSVSVTYSQNGSSTRSNALGIRPITPSLHLEPVSDDDFAIIDKAVMRSAYAVHNKFGRLFDERVYENDLAARLRAEGFDVHTQVPVLMTHGGFEKTYYLDLIVKQPIGSISMSCSRIPN